MEDALTSPHNSMTAPRGWLAFWLMTFTACVARVIASLMFPDVAVAYFNGGVDPCVGPGGAQSPECVSTLKMVTTITTGFRTTSAVLSFVSSPLVGLAAEYFGRKPIIFLSLGLILLQSCMLGAVVVFNVSIYWSYACIELVALMPLDVLLQLYITDCTEPLERAPMFAKLLAMTALEGLVSPLAMSLPPQVLLLTLLVLSLSAPLVACCVQESRPRQRTRTDADDVDQTVRARFAVLLKIMKHPGMRTISLLYLAGQAVSQGVLSILLFYFKERFGMDAQGMAPFLFISTLCAILGNLFLVKPLIRRFGLKGIILISYSIGLLYCLGSAVQFSIMLLAVTSVLGGAANLHMSAVQTIWTNAASKMDKEMGVTLGAITSLYSTASVIGPLLFTACFNVFQPFAGSPFLIGCVVDVASIAMWAWIPSSTFPDNLDAEPVSM